ncbi:hypothetical protein HAZT_HAZT012204 [Hyalella azteca]|uniref:Uncharacterized protein LOC108677369 n=1 Tax=Hyalella azteca TaxID=294128 RepID=A0A6A0HCG0_HYAAZ|nr:uncharacterized protein LOC108677369 [Hyalella azteca]KAA0202577.1 hypothetical protein HAZT_HAZT012204 [Hyalella azteca]
MIRSPLPKSDTPANSSAASRLAAVTRKQNNIEELLRNLNPDVPKIKALYTEYLVKVEAFLGACEADVSEEWISARRSVIDAFRLKVENFFTTNKPASEHGSHVSHSARSGSSRSSTSSVRIRIAQQRAKALAEQAVMKETFEIESKKLELQHRQRKAQAERMRIESDLLEQELNKIDLEDGLASEHSSRSAQSAIEDARQVDLHRSFAVERGTGPVREGESSSLLAVLAKQNEISSTLSRNQEQAALPKKTLQAFSGDVTEFKVFSQSFDRVIASRCSNDADKLAYLEQFTTGNPHKLVKSCVNSDAGTAYRNARDLLSSEYGDEFRVTNAYLEALASWPAVKAEDAESLSDLYVYLLKCQNYLEDLTYSNPLQNPKEIMAIVMKLPYRLRERWRRQTLHLHQQKKRVEFQHLVAFVREELALIKQPLFGTIADSVNDKKLSTSKSKRVLASSTAAVKSTYCEEQCPCCKKKNHPITSCLFFKEKTFEEKGDFIRKLGLCFGCLGSGHRSRECSQKLICSICQERHPTVMHLNKGAHSNGKSECSQLDDPSNKTASAQPPITHVTTNVVSGPGERRAVMCPVVPAKVRVGGTDKWIVTNVALDSHSTDCWMSGKLQSKLDCRLDDAQVDLSTMGSLRARTRTRIARDLIISDLHENKVAKAPLIFVKDEKDWPFTCSDVPTIDDVAPYDHLTCVPFDFVDTEIGLLIGMNFPGLMKPTSVVSGGWGEPFATQHWLGWALNGPVSSGGVSSCMRLKTDSLESELDKFFERDYVEPEDEQLISVEDLVWTKKVEANTKVLKNHHFEISLPFFDEKPKFPNNKQQILLRFQSLLRRFQRDEGYFKEYAAFIRDMMLRGYCEVIPANETETNAQV